MAKDPATLWYWNDWIGGTMTLSRHLKGCYMDLLGAQFNDGHLSLEQIKTVLGADFGSAWPTLQKKFTQDSNGNYYNVKAEETQDKRAKYSESRRKNREKTYVGTYEKHMSPHMENENRNVNVFESIKGGAGGGESASFPIERCAEIALADPRWIKANKVIDGELFKFNEYLEKQGKYTMNPLDYKTYFAKLKGKYPDLLKRTFTYEELQELAKRHP